MIFGPSWEAMQEVRTGTGQILEVCM